MHTDPEVILLLSLMAGVVGFFILIASPFWTICLIVILQVVVFIHYIPAFFSKWLFGAIFSLWLIIWAFSYILRRGENLWWHPVAKPTTFLAIVFGAGAIIGLLYGSTPFNIMKDMSQYLGYLAIFPVIDVVRSPRQATKIIKIFAILGLPGYMFERYSIFAGKQGIEGVPSLAPNAAPYWGPIEGALWAVALCYDKASVRLASWGWLGLSSVIPIFGGMRGIFLSYLAGAATAFKAAARLGNRSLARYMVPLVLGLILLGVFGLVKLPFSKVTQQQYKTLTSMGAFEGDRSVEGRLVEIRALLGAFKRNPVTGVGFGYPIKYYWGNRKIDTLWFTYHNGYAETLMKFGLIGSLIFAWFYWSALKMSYRLISSGDTFFSKALAFGTVVWLVSSLVLSAGNSMFSQRGWALAMGVIVGLLPALAGQNPYNRESQEKPPSSPANEPRHDHVIHSK